MAMSLQPHVLTLEDVFLKHPFELGLHTWPCMYLSQKHCNCVWMECGSVLSFAGMYGAECDFIEVFAYVQQGNVNEASRIIKKNAQFASAWFNTYGQQYGAWLSIPEFTDDEVVCFANTLIAKYGARH